uniref:Uncharacterized protein n=1 Tax=Vitis vinifera TaxID=29760 RepID=F6H5K3_VITVI
MGLSDPWNEDEDWFFDDEDSDIEEKKESLLTKCQGKGADFVRAAQEIIDSYEELKKQDQVDDFNSAIDVAVTNSENLVDSSSNSGLKDQPEAPTVAVNSRLKTSYSAEDRSEPKLLEKVQNELLSVFANQLLEKEHSGCHALLRDDKVDNLSRKTKIGRKWPHSTHIVGCKGDSFGFFFERKVN